MPNQSPESNSATCQSSACSACGDASPNQESIALGASIFRIPTMDCASEEGEIRRALEGIEGIRSLSFQLSARTLAITASADALPAALAAIRAAGFKPVSVGAGTRGSSDDRQDSQHDHDHADGGALSSGVARLALALALASLAEAIHYLAPQALAFKIAGFVVAAAAIGLAGFDTYVKGFAALRRGKLNISALMSVAVSGALAIGQWPEAAMVMALYALAELIEARSVDRARNAIAGLLDLTPAQAEVRQADGTWISVPATEVELGATVRIRPGQRVPLDGVVNAGSSAVNQAPVTGESIPVDKSVDDAVFAGSINQAGELEFRVTAAASNTLLARIIHAVEQAQGARAPTQRFVDQFAAIYTPVVFVLAVAVALTTPWLMGWPWLQALYKALVLLVIACPCALVISTPVTVVSALASAARRGILIKGGSYLEDARRIKVITLDKTGTVTEGKPRLIEWQAWETALSNPDQVARIAGHLSSRSDHPVSQAIAQGLAREVPQVGLPDRELSMERFEALPGRGVQAVVGGRLCVLGNHRLIEERGQCSAALEARLLVHEQAGRTVTLLADESGVLGLFAVADAIKPSSHQAIADLKALGVTPVMLTGDNAATARAIATEAGIAEAHGNLLPQDKLLAVEAAQRQHGLTAMVGDGINDAPALARADIGIAMGGAGTDIAMEAADVVIMNDDLRRIPMLIHLSRQTHVVLWQNISLALGIKAVFFVLAVFGSATMWMAVFADMGASLLVVANGLRLLKVRLEIAANA